jgi:PAS domain S-box-containing protein
MAERRSDIERQERDLANLALSVVDHVPSMVAYWDANQTCLFVNNAYLDWFGKTREQLIGTTMKDLLGPIYPMNQPYIEGVLAGERQVFERQIPLPDGSGIRSSLATYIPDEHEGVVRGFFVLVSDTSRLTQRERELTQALAERDRALAEVRELRRFMSMCASCRRVRDEDGGWIELERYVKRHTHTRFSHGLCPECAERLYPDEDAAAGTSETAGNGRR